MCERKYVQYFVEAVFVQIKILPKWHVVKVELVVVIQSNAMSGQLPFSAGLKDRLTLNHSVLTSHFRLGKDLE